MIISVVRLSRESLGRNQVPQSEPPEAFLLQMDLVIFLEETVKLSTDTTGLPSQITYRKERRQNMPQRVKECPGGWKPILTEGRSEMPKVSAKFISWQIKGENAYKTPPPDPLYVCGPRKICRNFWEREAKKEEM